MGAGDDGVGKDASDASVDGRVGFVSLCGDERGAEGAAEEVVAAAVGDIHGCALDGLGIGLEGESVRCGLRAADVRTGVANGCRAVALAVVCSEGALLLALLLVVVLVVVVVGGAEEGNRAGRWPRDASVHGLRAMAK